MLAAPCTGSSSPISTWLPPSLLSGLNSMSPSHQDHPEPLFKTSSSMPSQALNTTPGSRPHRATGFPPVQVPFQVWPSWVSLPSLTTTLTPGKVVFTAAPSSPQIIDGTGGRLRFSQLWNGKPAPGHTMAQRRKQLSIQPKGSPLAWSSRLAEGAGVTDTGRRKCKPSRGAAEIPVGGDVAQG